MVRVSASSKLNRQIKNRQVAEKPAAWIFSGQDGVVSCFTMFPPFDCMSCADAEWQQKQKSRKLRMLRFWRDGLERQLAAVSAAISTLEQQIERDQSAQS